MEEHITKTLIESQYPLWEIILLFIVIQFIIILCSEWIKKIIEKKRDKWYYKKNKISRNPIYERN